MLEEVKTFFTPTMTTNREGKIMVDATVGFGGHTSSLISLWHAKCFSLHDTHTSAQASVLVHAVDADGTMLDRARENLHQYEDMVHFHEMFNDEFFVTLPDNSVDFILVDLGISMYHFKESGRGFSFSEDALLDMRLSRHTEASAYELVNFASEQRLKEILYTYGEERHATKWVNRIVNARRTHAIRTVHQLCDTLQLSKKYSDRKTLMRIFQALRIAVNDELSRLSRMLPDAWRTLKKKGRLVVISFHSLEDRIVKQFFKHVSSTLKNDADIPKNNIPRIYNIQSAGSGRVLTKKPITPQKEEIEKNYASRSAKLRVAEKTV